MKKADLEEYTFPGTDAAVMHFPKEVEQKELEEIFGDIDGDHRIYSTPDGWKVKFPYWYLLEVSKHADSGITSEHFEREEKGWDHEHCSFCHAHIHMGDKSFTHDHEKGGVYVICLECVKKM